MFNLSKKKICCKNCSQILDRYHSFDINKLSLFKGFRSIKLCTSCMIKEYKKDLMSFSDKAVFMEPLKNYPDYCYYTFKEIFSQKWWPDEGINRLQDMINKKNYCKICQKDAFFLLCSPEIYDNDPLKPFDVNKINEDTCRHLCIDCLCNQLEIIVKRENIYFNLIYPPIIKENGLATSFNTHYK